eukprot:2719878-Rhodomonas_salina.1
MSSGGTSPPSPGGAAPCSSGLVTLGLKRSWTGSICGSSSLCAGAGSSVGLSMGVGTPGALCVRRGGVSKSPPPSGTILLLMAWS